VQQVENKNLARCTGEIFVYRFGSLKEEVAINSVSRFTKRVSEYDRRFGLSPAKINP
jgi:hypothetical protein